MWNFWNYRVSLSKLFVSKWVIENHRSVIEIEKSPSQKKDSEKLKTLGSRLGAGVVPVSIRRRKVKSADFKKSQYIYAPIHSIPAQSYKSQYYQEAKNTILQNVCKAFSTTTDFFSQFTWARNLSTSQCMNSSHV